MVLASTAAVERHGLAPMASVVSFSDGEGAPMDFPSAPAIAIRKLLEATGVDKEDVAIWEINEAFSTARVNPFGGAVALGHPIGMSGAGITATLLYLLQPGELGCAAICNGGGGATAILLEKL